MAFDLISSQCFLSLFHTGILPSVAMLDTTDLLAMACVKGRDRVPHFADKKTGPQGANTQSRAARLGRERQEDPNRYTRHGGSALTKQAV